MSATLTMTQDSNRAADLSLAAFAFMIWGSSYVIATELLPGVDPLLVALLRILPAGLFLMLFVRRLPKRALIGKLLILGLLNFAIFQTLLFVSAYRLPGGVAATLASLQPLLVMILTRAVLQVSVPTTAILASVTGIAGVALLILGPDAALDATGIAAALTAAASMALGTVLIRKWLPGVPPVTGTAWQLTAGGLLMLPLALMSDSGLPSASAEHVLGLAWLSLAGGALAYLLLFRAISRHGPANVTLLGFFSPLTAVVLGLVLLDQTLSLLQCLGVAIILGSILAGQRAATRGMRG